MPRILDPQPVSRESTRPLTDREFEQFRELAYERFGLDLKDGKQGLVAARLGKKLREHGFRTFQAYYEHVLADSTGEALVVLIDALTTNFTSFLREPAHFDYLRKTILPEIRSSERIRIWSAACSTGEEPYTIAFSVLEELGSAARGRFELLATDISTKALGTALTAVYPAERFEGFPRDWMRRYLRRGDGRWRGWYRVKPEVRSVVEFRRLNLMEPFAHLLRFHVVFCRNVMIYFDKPTQADLVARLTDRLEPDGYLLTGHSESLLGKHPGLSYVRPAVYRKAPGGLSRTEPMRHKRCAR